MNRNAQENWISTEFEKGLFSVIIPVYNRSDVVKETLDCLLLQDYPKIEIIIIDDGSTDKSAEIIHSWLEKNAIRFQSANYYYQENAGVCAARNHGLSISRGEFMQYLDSDDLIHSDRLSILVEAFLANANIKYIETGYESFYTEKGMKVIASQSKGHVDKNHLELLCKGKLWPNTLRPAYRRSLVQAIGPWNVSMKTFEDYEYVIRAITCLNHDEVFAIEDVLAGARRDTANRRSDIFLTHKGRSMRIHCETVLASRVINIDEINQQWVSALKSRLYALAFRTKLLGYKDLFKEIFQVAENISAPLNGKAKQRKLICSLPKPFISVYNKLGQIKAS